MKHTGISLRVRSLPDEELDFPYVEVSDLTLLRVKGTMNETSSD